MYEVIIDYFAQIKDVFTDIDDYHKHCGQQQSPDSQSIIIWRLNECHRQLMHIKQQIQQSPFGGGA